MSGKEQTDVLIDQNRNTIRANWMPRDPPADYITQCDRVPKHVYPHVSCQDTEHTFKVPHVNSLPTNTGDSDGQMFTRLKEHSTGNTVNENVCPNNLPSSSTDRQNGEVVTEEDDTDRDESVSKEMLQRRVCLVKLYAWIKEEMSKSAAKSIASHLYQSEHRLLSRLDHESILHCSWRRDAVEQLLKKVLMGPEDIHEVFIRALKEQEEKHIAEKLMKESATESEISVFLKLEKSSLGECQRPDIHEQRLSFTDSDHQTLLYYLNNKNAIDSVNDNLLSRFIFSIREHTNVVHCSLDCEKRVRQLIDTMKICAEKIFKDFCEILNSIEMSHVIGKLEKRSQGAVTCRQRQKRKPSSAQGTDPEAESSTSAKRLKSSIECRLVSSMQRSSSVLNLQANDQLGFSVEKVNNGSIVIQLCPKEPDSWNRLEENCRTGKIKDFIPVVYNNEAVYELLEDGEYRLKFTIYTLPTQPDKQGEKKVMFHLETEEGAQKDITEREKVSTIQHDNPIEECLDLLCEELEINKELLTLLIKEDLVEKNIKEEIDKQGSRAKKNKFLLKKIGIHGQKGYEILKEYLQEENEDLYQALITREGVKNIDSKMDTAAMVTKKRPSGGGHRGVYKKEVFFTGTVVLVVKKKVVGKKKESSSEIEITCPEIIDPVCHFAAKGKEKQMKSGEVTMVLEDAWNLVGANKPRRRENLVGKRKQSKDEACKSKRVHTSTDSEDSEDEDASCPEVKSQDTNLKEKTSTREEKGKGASDEENDSCDKENPRKENKHHKQ